MSAKSSINFQKSKQGALAHNDRTEEVEPDHLLAKEFRLKNKVDFSAKDAKKKIEVLTEQSKITGKKFHY